MLTRRHVTATLAAGLLAPVGCGSRREPLRVFAASSLTDVFAQAAQVFRSQSGHRCALSHAGSQVLRLQIEHGAPADVFASANPEHVQGLHAAGVCERPTLFARNRLVVAVPINASARRWVDLRSIQRLVRGTDDVPFGRYAAQVLEVAGASDPVTTKHLRAHTLSHETNVRLALARLETGAADAAFVYRSDLTHRPSLRAIDVPADAAAAAIAEYRIAVVTATPRPAEAQAFVDFMRSSTGQELLRQHGFEP